MTATPGFEPFPPDTGTDDGELYVHSVTGDDYIYDKDKGCWRVISAVKQKVFAQALPPDIPTNAGATPGYVPTRGDMWWDTNLLELRVWNQPDPEDPNDTVPTPGRWISSTNPHMSPLSPSKNLVIGQLSILDQDGQPFKAKVVYEDTLYTLQVQRTDSNAAEKLIKYEWRSIPETIAGQPVKFSSPTGTLTKVEIPPLGRDSSGNIIPQSVRIYCKVTAIDKVDTFIEPTKEVNTGVLPIREIPISGVPIAANTKALLLSESDVGIGTDTIGKYLVYEIDAAELDFDDNYANAFDDYPHEDTYVIQKAQLSATQETSTVEFIYDSDDTMNNYRLSFWEDKNRTVPWGTSPDTGANLGVISETQRKHQIIVDKDFIGNVYFSKNPPGSSPTMAGHLEWGTLPPSEGSIGNVSILGAPDPEKNVVSQYAIQHDGDIDAARLVVTYSTDDPLAEVNGDEIKFGTEGTFTVNALVKSFYADDSPKTASLVVFVGAGLSKIGAFHIKGDTKAVVGLPVKYSYEFDGDATNETVTWTTNDSAATVTDGSIIFNTVGSFTVQGKIEADNVTDSPQFDTLSVSVEDGIASEITSAEDLVDTGKPYQYSLNVTGTPLTGSPTYEWKTSRSEGGVEWRAEPADIVSGFTSGREFGEELVDADISGDSYIVLESKSGATEGLYITFPKALDPTSVGAFLSVLDADGNPTSDSVNITLAALKAGDTIVQTLTASVDSDTPVIRKLSLDYNDEEITGMKLNLNTGGYKLAVHGFTIDGFTIESYLNDIVENKGEDAVITMFRYDEQRTVQCTAEGDNGRTIARKTVDVQDPPEPSLGNTKFQSPAKLIEKDTETEYTFETTENTVDVSYTAGFEVTSIEGDAAADSAGLYEFDDSDIDNGVLKLTVNATNDAGDDYTVFTGKITLAIADARDPDDLEDGESILNTVTASVAGIKVNI